MVIRPCSRPRHDAFSVERLETRALLTATISRGILSIRGTVANDVIEVRRSADAANVLQVVENGRVTFSRVASAVRQIWVNGGDGHDEIIVNQANGVIAIPTTIRGGRGNDLLQGGSGTNWLDGGLDRDAFQPGGGRDVVVSASRVDQLSRLGTATAFRDYLANAARNRGRLGLMATAMRDQWNTPAAVGNSSATAGSLGTTVTAAPGHSQTNTQVAGVDEGDLIENDGRHLYVLSRDELVIVDAQDADAPMVVSRTAIEGSAVAHYLHEGRLTVLSSIWTPPTFPGNPSNPGIMLRLGFRHVGQVQATVYDVADPAAPRFVSSTRIDGGYIDSRMVDGRLALVLQNDLLAGYWSGAPSIMPVVMPAVRPATGVSSGAVSDWDLTRRIRQAPVEQMLPTWTTTAMTSAGARATSAPQLVSRPQDVLSPALGNEANLTSLVLIDTRAVTPGITGATSVIGGYATTLHMNAEELYVFSPRWESIRGPRTDVQKFDITGTAPVFVASGSFDGSLVNQFAADDHGDFLRVAVTETTPAGTRSNALHVLAAQGNTLAVVGSVENIAPGESIMSARFLGETAYMVTFEQVDPLFVVDLSEPTAPRVAGELKVPGFSRFLQPLAGGFLLGVGRDADPDTGRLRGLKVSLFDVRDASAPREAATFLVDQPANGWSSSSAEWNHHALGFFPELGVVTLPVESSAMVVDASSAGVPTWQMRSGVVVLAVDTMTGITQLGTVEHDSFLLRTARIGSTLFSVADLDLKAVDVVGGGLTPRGSAILQQPYETIYATF
ncbi:MAG: beta-propeller domain-containing protein [Planctomycetia bacterium]